MAERHVVEAEAADRSGGVAAAHDRDIADRIIEVSDADSFAFTRRLAREEALLVGGSSGMAAFAAVQLARELDDPEAVIVVLPDWFDAEGAMRLDMALAVLDETRIAVHRTALPPLLRGYLRLGAKVCGEPAHDPDFGVADLYVLLSLRDTNPRYLRHFLSLLPA